MNNIYNSAFFNEFYAENGGGNLTDRNLWMPFFTRIADNIVERFNPRSVLDAGCAMGYIVELLRDRGVDAYGFDISEYAIGRVREDIRPYCFVHSITEKLPEEYPQKYDMVLTVEVLEHLFPEMGSKAIANLCHYSDTVLFSSTPDDITDRTHVNVQLPEYWAKEFARNGFYRELTHSVQFLSPWALLFTKKEDVSSVVFDYEMNMRINDIMVQKKLDQVIKEKDALINEKDALINEKDALIKEKASMVNSKSWKITAPLRALKRIFR